MAGLLNIGTQALNAHQIALDITGQNIANVNTDGYSRQSVLFESGKVNVPGVRIDSVNRTVDSFSIRQLWTDTSIYYASSSFVNYANQLDDRLADSSTSISASMNDFFAGLQTSLDDPSSVTNRELVLAQAESLAQRFQSMDSFMERQNLDITSQVGAWVSEASQITSQIAELNGKITYTITRGDSANELKDQREELVRQLSSIIGVTIQNDSDNENINIFTGNGQPLVIGTNSNTMSVTSGSPDPDDLKVMVNVSGTNVEVGEGITTGKVGGLLTYRDEMLIPSWNELGRLAMVFTDSMNEVHQQGMDLNGELGLTMFSDLSNSGKVIGFTENKTVMASTPRVQITDVSAIQASDYELTFTATNNFTIIRESDGQQFKLTDFTLDNSDPANQADMTYFADPATGDLRLNFDGMTITLNSENGFVKGDKFLIKPVRNGAEDIQLNLTNGYQLAIANPVKGTEAIDNTGYGEITDVTLTNAKDTSFASAKGQLTPPVEIVFNAGSPTTFNVYDISNPSNPVPYMLNSTTPATELTGVPYTSGEAIQLNGFSVTINNQPDPGDQFTFGYNVDGVSDNDNGFKLSELQNSKLVSGGASYQDNYGLLVERVGTRTSVAQLNVKADETVLNSSIAVRESVSGVNLDEEAANLVRFQQAYQAAAQLISASRTMFDTLLNVTN